MKFRVISDSGKIFNFWLLIWFPIIIIIIIIIKNYRKQPYWALHTYFGKC